MIWNAKPVFQFILTRCIFCPGWKILSCEHIFFKNGMGILLANFNSARILAKDAVNPRSREIKKTVAGQIDLH